MTTRDRIYGVVFALFFGPLGGLVVWIGFTKISQIGPQASAVFIFAGVICVLAAIRFLWISLTPSRWWADHH